MTKRTPHIDALDAARSAVHASTLGCSCRHAPAAGTRERTLWLSQHGTLCKKRTKGGWRRAWQCKTCLGNMGGDGKNAGPPTQDLPEYLEIDNPTRKLVRAARLSAYDRGVSNLPQKRDAWFKDHDLYLRSDAWKALREATLKRDGFRCVRCNRPAEQVHHLTYDRWQEEELSDLVSLCRPCHEKEHAE